MSGYERTETDPRRDLRIWSDACERVVYSDVTDTYRCDTCATITLLDHDVNHDGFIHITVDVKTA